MLMEDRKKYILKKLEEQSSVTIAHLSSEFQLSEVSVRKLLINMEKDGLLKRTWGGAVSVPKGLPSNAAPVSYTSLNKEQKSIAQEAYRQINDGEAIALTPGPISVGLAHCLAKGPKKNLIVCTSALDIAMELGGNSNLSVLVFGGEFRAEKAACVGGRTILAISQHYFDRCFIDAPFFNFTSGVTASNPAEADVLKVVAERGKHQYVMAESKKLDGGSLVQILPMTRMEHLITDWHLTAAQREKLSCHKIQVLSAAEPAE